MFNRSSDDPFGLYGGWKSYFIASYALASVAALCGVRHWSLWIALASVPMYLLFLFPYKRLSFGSLLFWMLLVGVVVAAVHGAGGILEHWRTPRRMRRSAALLFVAIATEVWFILSD